jgi:F-type H+-transporting ATPase subunit delta
MSSLSNKSEASYRYAKALFRIQASEKIDTLLKASIQLLQHAPLFAPFLEHPEVRLEAKTHVLKLCFQEPLLVRFLILLIVHKRLKSLSAIAYYYHSFYLNSQGMKEAKLITAKAVAPSLVQKFQQQLEAIHHQKFAISTEVDPKLIGGAILFVGNTFVDYSLKGRLGMLQDYLLKGFDGH